jgi:hypothetical protein
MTTATAPAVTTFDVPSFHAYCAKYRIAKKNAATILRAFEAARPPLQQLPKEYDWQKAGIFGFVFGDFKVEMSNYGDHGQTRVTFIGIKGVNWAG